MTEGGSEDMEHMVDSYMVPVGQGKGLNSQIGMMGKNIIWGMLESHGFEVESGIQNSSFDLVARNGVGNFAIEVKTLLSQLSNIGMPKRDRWRKRYFCIKNKLRPMMVVLELDEQGEKLCKFYIGYRMGIKSVKRPWVKSFDEFFKAEGKEESSFTDPSTEGSYKASTIIQREE